MGQRDRDPRTGLPEAVRRILATAVFERVDEATQQDILRSPEEEREFRVQLVLRTVAALAVGHAPGAASAARSRDLRQRILATWPVAQAAEEMEVRRRGQKRVLQKNVISRIADAVGCKPRVVQTVLGRHRTPAVAAAAAKPPHA